MRTELTISINQRIIARAHPANAWHDAVSVACWHAIGYQVPAAAFATYAIIAGIRYDYPAELITWVAAYDEEETTSSGTYTLTLHE